MLIRNIETDDAERLLSLLKTLDQETQFMLYEPSERTTTVEEMKAKITAVKKSSALYLVVEEGSELVGFISAERGFANRIKHRAYIVVGILERYIGLGIGTKLFEALEGWARQESIRRLELTVMAHNARAIKLYKKFGFRIEGVKESSIRINGAYIDEFYMAKIL